MLLSCHEPTNDDAAVVKSIEDGNRFLRNQYHQSVNRFKVWVGSQPHGITYFRMSTHIDSLLQPFLASLDSIPSDSVLPRYRHSLLCVNNFLKPLRNTTKPAYFLSSDTAQVWFFADSAVFDLNNTMFRNALIRKNMYSNMIRLTDLLRDCVGISSDWFIRSSDIGYKLIIEKQPSTCYFALTYQEPMRKPDFIPLHFVALKQRADGQPDHSIENYNNITATDLQAGKEGLRFRTPALAKGDYAIVAKATRISPAGVELSDEIVIYFQLN